jgi:hypothetical protein
MNKPSNPQYTPDRPQQYFYLGVHLMPVFIEQPSAPPEPPDRYREAVKKVRLSNGFGTSCFVGFLGVFNKFNDLTQKLLRVALRVLLAAGGWCFFRSWTGLLAARARTAQQGLPAFSARGLAHRRPSSTNPEFSIGGLSPGRSSLAFAAATPWVGRCNRLGDIFFHPTPNLTGA